MIVFAIGILTVAVPVMVVGDSVRIAIPVAFPEALSIVMRCHQRPPGYTVSVPLPRNSRRRDHVAEP
jgi:hypothetical protein